MCLHQAASYSYDNYANAISILFIAYAISCIYEKNMFSRKDYIILLMLGILLAPAKVVYLPIVFMVFLAVRRWKADIKGKAWAAAFSITGAAIVAALFIFVMRSGEFTGAGLNWEGETNYTLSFLFTNPVQAAEIFIRTLLDNIIYFTYGAFGRYLSGITLFVPRYFISISIALVVLGVLYGERDEWQPSIQDRIVYLLIFAAVVFLCLLSLFLGMTSDFHNRVIGVQGRYFTPLIPLFMLALRCKKLLIPKSFYQNAIIIAFLVVQGVIINYILNFTINNFFLW